MSSATDSASIAAARDIATVLALLATAWGLAVAGETQLASTALGGALAFAVPSSARRAAPAALALGFGLLGAAIASVMGSA